MRNLLFGKSLQLTLFYFYHLVPSSNWRDTISLYFDFLHFFCSNVLIKNSLRGWYYRVMYVMRTKKETFWKNKHRIVYNRNWLVWLLIFCCSLSGRCHSTKKKLKIDLHALRGTCYANNKLKSKNSYGLWWGFFASDLPILLSMSLPRPLANVPKWLSPIFKTVWIQKVRQN